MGLLLLVRHGQASFGADDYDVLSDLGLAQGRRLGETLAGQGMAPVVVRHGSLRRQRDTAGAVAQAAGWPVPVEVDERWDEFDHLGVLGGYGETTAGLDHRGFQAAFESATARWTAGEPRSTNTVADETFVGFLERVRSALGAAAESVGSGETAVMVTSGGVIAAACALMVGDPQDLRAVAGVWSALNTVTVNTAVTRVIVGASGLRLLTFNEHTHLLPDQVSYR